MRCPGEYRPTDLCPFHVAPPCALGVDKLKGKQGDTLFAFDGPGFVVFGNEDAEALIKRIAAKPDATLSTKLSDDLRQALLGGDFGLYVNMVTVQNRYKNQIDAMRDQLMAALDQAADQLQNNNQMDHLEFHLSYSEEF